MECGLGSRAAYAITLMGRCTYLLLFTQLQYAGIADNTVASCMQASDAHAAASQAPAIRQHEGVCRQLRSTCQQGCSWLPRQGDAVDVASMGNGTCCWLSFSQGSGKPAVAWHGWYTVQHAMYHPGGASRMASSQHPKATKAVQVGISCGCIILSCHN